MGLTPENTTFIYECGDHGDWESNIGVHAHEIPNCQETGCTKFLHEGYPVKDIVAKGWDGDEVPTGDPMTVTCRNGMLIRPDTQNRERNVTCLQGNRWSEPSPMFECFHTQYCPTPPSEPNVQGTYDYDPASFNGTVRLNKPGIYSGGKCLGQQGTYARLDAHEKIETPPSCRNISVSTAATHHDANAVNHFAEIRILLRGPMPNNTFWLNLTFSQEILSWHEHGRGAPFHVSNGTYNDAVDGDWRHYQYVYGIHDVQHLRAQDQAAWRVIQVGYDYDGSRLLCLYDVACGEDEQKSSVTYKRDTSNSDYRPATYTHMLRSEVSYQCGPGRRFHMSPGSHQLYMNYTCDLDEALGQPGKWSPAHPYDDLNPCEWTHCAYPPMPPENASLHALVYKGAPYDYEEGEVVIAEKLEYHCFNGRKNVLDFGFTFQEASCASENEWTPPAVWENCTTTKWCSGAPSGAVVRAVSTGNSFGVVCHGTDTGGDPEPLPYCPNVAVLYTKLQPGLAGYTMYYTTDSVRADKIFLRTRFDAPVLNIDSNEGSFPRTMADQVVGIYQEVKLDPVSTRSFSFNVSFDPDYSTICIADMVCNTVSKTDSGYDAFKDSMEADLAGQTFYEENQAWPYETTLEYKCQRGQSFRGGNNETIRNQTMSCLWDGNWDVSVSLDTCYWTHCDRPPAPPGEKYLEPDWVEGALIDFNSTISYHCARGMKFKQDFALETQEAICRPGNTWDEPTAWLDCRETNYCMKAPDPPQDGGSVYVRNSGLSYGHNCSTNGVYEDLASSGSCDTVTIKQVSSEVQGADRVSTYKIHISKIPPGGSVVSYLTFTQPVTNQSVHITNSDGMTLQGTRSVNTLQAEIKLSNTAPSNFIDMTITAPAADQEPCLVFATCDYCVAEEGGCANVTKVYDTNATAMQEFTNYGSSLEYRCSLGKQFRQSPQSKATQESYNISCDWEGAWQPSSQIWDCVWVACIEPTIPPNETHLIRHYSGGTTVPFGWVADYSCEPGYYFGEDFNMTHFNLTCYKNGSWEAPEHWKQCYQPTERFCFDPPEPAYNGGRSTWNPRFKGSKTPFGTQVEYSCGLGRRLHHYTENDTIIYDSKTLTCSWDRTWSPSEPLDECQWTQCVDPPVPEGHRVKPTWDGVTPYEFYTNATYVCDSDEVFFEHDRNLESFSVMCTDSGRWSLPREWPTCVETVYCPDPPPVPPGGTWEFDDYTNNTYGKQAKYQCGPYAKFKSADGNVYTESVVTCQWDKKWSKQKLDPCKFEVCPVVPEPPSWTNYVYNDPNSTLDLLTDYLSYDPQLPETIKVHPEFPDKRQLFVDGYVAPRKWNDNLPQFTFTDIFGRVIFHIKLDPENSQIVVKSGINYNLPSTTFVSALAFGAPFEMVITLDQTTNHFKGTFNGEEIEPYYIPDKELVFDKLTAVGDIQINHLGFSLRGKNPAVVEGTEIVYTCPAGYFFEHDIYAPTKQKIRCTDSGTFKQPEEWFRCLAPPTTTTTTTKPVEDQDTTTRVFPSTNVTTVAQEDIPYNMRQYPKTTDYHWPQFFEDATGITGEWTNGEGVGTGPIGFGFSVKLTQESCMHDSSWVNEGDTCVENPINCEEGLSFSIWEKITYDSNVLVDRENAVQDRKYIVSSGGDYDPIAGTAYPGFAVYHEGPNLVAVVSTGEEVWHLSVTGIIMNRTWVNIGITWNKPNLEDSSLPVEKLGGLEMYINQEKVGSTLLPEFTDDSKQTFVPVTNYTIGGKPPPVMMIGCHFDHSRNRFGGFSGGEYDELALWNRKLESEGARDETIYFLGGASSIGYRNVTPEEVLGLIEEVDLSDPSQAQAARDAVGEMLKPPDDSLSPIPTRPPKKKPQQEESGSDENDVNEPNTDTGEEDSSIDIGELALKQIGLQKVISSMLDVKDFGEIMDPALVEPRLSLSVIASQLLAGSDEENVAKWEAVHRIYPEEAGASRTLTELMTYMQTWVGAVNTTVDTGQGTRYYDPETGSMKYNTSGDDFVMNSFKLPVEEFRREPRLALPFYDGEAWKERNDTWGGPRDVVSIPTGIFKDEAACRDSDVTFTFGIFNKMDKAFPRRRNMGFIRNLDWAVDCRIFSNAVSTNADPYNADAANLEIARRCRPSQEYMQKNPIRYTCEHFLPESARFRTRRPLQSSTTTTWFSQTLLSGIEVRHCVRWNEDFGTNGAWDPTGCTLIKTDALETKCECMHFGAQTVVLEQSQQWHHEDVCDPENLIKYVGIGFTCFLLLVFILVTAAGRGVWDMFHTIRMHTAATWTAAVLFHVVADSQVVRDSRELNLYAGLAMKYCLTSSVTWASLECHAMFKAFTAGIVSQRSKVYNPFGYGTPLLPLGILFLGFADDLGLDPRCFVGWNMVAKGIYLTWNTMIAVYGLVVSFILALNLTHPQTRKRNIVAALRSNAEGVIMMAVAKFIFWICATVTYLHDPESSVDDPYCSFIVLLGWIGVFFFVCLGPWSKQWRYGFCCRNATDVYRLDNRRWGDEPVIEQSGVDIKGALLRTPLSTADVFWRDRNTNKFKNLATAIMKFGEGDMDNKSEVSRETALPSPSPPPSAEPAGEGFFDFGGQGESVSRPITAKSAFEAVTSSRPASTTEAAAEEPEELAQPFDELEGNGGEDSIDETVAQILDDDDDEALDD